VAGGVRFGHAKRALSFGALYSEAFPTRGPRDQNGGNDAVAGIGTEPTSYTAQPRPDRGGRYTPNPLNTPSELLGLQTLVCTAETCIFIRPHNI
jgi:hypothetical protein